MQRFFGQSPQNDSVAVFKYKNGTSGRPSPTQIKLLILHTAQGKIISSRFNGLMWASAPTQIIKGRRNASPTELTFYIQKNGACDAIRTHDRLFTREMPSVNKVNSLPVCCTSELCERSMCKCPPRWKRARQPTEPVGRNFCKKMELVMRFERMTYSLRERCRL